MNELLQDEVLVQHIADTRLNILKEIIEWHGEEELGPTDRQIFYKNNDVNGEFVSDKLVDNIGIVEMIKNHLTNGRTSNNPGTNQTSAGGNREPVVAPYVSPDGKWDIDRAVSWINANSLNKSVGSCAKYVRMAIEAGGVSTVGRPVAACNYTGFLPTKGFKHIATLSNKQEQAQFSSSNAQKGDIAVMSHGKYGHICMWNGSQWISDFKQNNMWPYSGNGVCRIFRYGA